MSIFNEVQQMEHLTVIGKALINYAISIEPGLVFERNSVGWVPNDERNFVGFRFQWTDSLCITLSLFGLPDEHFVQEDLDIKKGKCANSLCRITDNGQLMAASVSIWRAHQLFLQGSNRDRRALLLIDELKPVPPAHGHWQQSQPEVAVNNVPGEVVTEAGPDWFEEVNGLMRAHKVTDPSLP